MTSRARGFAYAVYLMGAGVAGLGLTVWRFDWSTHDPFAVIGGVVTLGFSGFGFLVGLWGFSYEWRAKPLPPNVKETPP